MNWSYESDKRILITYEGGTLTSGDVVAGSFSLTERLCSFDQLEIGSCEASELRFSVSNPDVKLKGKAITVEFFNPDQPNNKYTLGHYTVETDKAIEKRTQREIVAYDDMYWLAQLNVTSWLASFFGTSASKTVSELVSSLGTKIGKTIPIPSAVASYKVYKTDTLFAVMATDVLRALGELIGGSYRIGRDGNLKFVNLLTTPTYTTYEVGKVVDAEYEEYTVGAITKVVIQNNNEDVSKTAGGGTNAYTITGNMLLSDDGITESGQDYANRLWQGLGGLTYVPFNAEVVANPEVEVGSGVTITFRDGSTISSIIFERTLNGIQGMTDSFSADGKETREIESGIQTAITSLGQQTAEISSTVDGLSSTVGKFSSTYVSQSVYEQDSKTIGLKVEEIERNITSLEEEIDGEVEVYNLDYEPTFSKNADDTLVTANYPAITFTYNIYVHPDEATLINGNIPFLYKDEYLQKNSRDLAFNTTDGQSYRFVKEDGAYHWKPIADTDFGIAMQRIAELTVESGKIESRVAETETAITAQDKQITQNTSDIKQTAHSIDLTVSDSMGKTTGIRIALKDKDGNEISHNEGNIVLSGDVVVKGNLSDGTTTISGSNITTGTINCDNVTLSNLKWASVTDHPTSLSEFSNATTGYQTAQNVETIVSNDLTTYTTNVVNKKLTAKVEDATSNASWDLSSTAFSVSSKGNEVLRVDGSGLNVNGKGTFSGDISAAKITVGGVAKGTSEAVTAITESTITTTSVTANNLKVKAANVDGKLTASQIETDKITIGTTQVNGLGDYVEGDVNSAIGNVSVGGTNLLTGTHGKDRPWVFTSALKDGFDLFPDTGIIEVEPNQTYIISCESDGTWTDKHVGVGTHSPLDKDCSCWIYLRYKDSTQPDYGFDEAIFLGHEYDYSCSGGDTNKGRAIWKWTAPANAYTIRMRYNIYSNGTSQITVKFWNLQVEKGNKSTDWSPAPADISVDNIYVSGTTKINGGLIETGTIKADSIDVDDLFAQDITASNLHITDGTIDIANGAFKVDYHGYLEAQDADITGKITSSDATITGGTVQIETATGGLDSYITLNDVYQQTQNKVTVSPRAITAYGKQANSNAYKEVRISGYSESFAISVETRDGENNESTYIDAGEIEINGEQVLVPSSLEWIAQTLSITNGQSKQFFKGTYKTLVLEGYVSGSAPYQTITIPIRTITTSAKSYGISWGTSTLTAKVSLVSNNIKVECVSSGYGVWANAYLRR